MSISDTLIEISNESLLNHAEKTSLSLIAKEVESKDEQIKELKNLLEQLIFIAEKATTDDSEDTTIELANQALESK